MEQAGGSSSAAEQSHSPAELHLLRLVICGMRAAARAASAGSGHTRGRSLEAAACRVIARQAQRDHEFVHGLWCSLRAASLRKLRAHLARGDAAATRERLSALDWAVVDLLLLYDTPLLSVASFHQRAQLRALERTFQLVQQLHLESEDGEVAPDRWSRAAREYSTNGVQLSAVALQRRWHELKLDARRRACAPAMDGTPRPLVLPIHQAVANRYPHVASSSELLTWRQLVAAGNVAEPTSERGPAPGETLEPSRTDRANSSVDTIDLSDDETDRNRAQETSSHATLITVPDNELAGSSYNKSKCKSRHIRQNKSISKESDLDNINIKVKPEIIEIDDDDDAPSPDVVEAMQEIDFRYVKATIVYESDEEEVKTVLDVNIGNVDKDAGNAAIINDNVVSKDVENSMLSGEIKNEVETNSNDGNDIKIANEDICKNIADSKIDIEEHILIKKEGSSEMEENEVKCSSPNLNVKIENIRQTISVKTDKENVINNETANNSVLCRNLEKLSSDQLIEEILRKCKVVPEFNDEHSILRLVLNRDRRQNTAKIDSNDTTKIDDTDLQNRVKIEPSSEIDIVNDKPIWDFPSGGVKKDAESSGNVNKLSKKDDDVNEMSEYFIDANLIKSKIETHFNENYMDPKLLMFPVILLRRIDEVLNIPLKKSQPTYSESQSHKFEIDVHHNEEIKSERLWKTIKSEPSSPLNHQKLSVRPSYSRMFYEKNKVLLRKLKSCAVPLRRVDEDWGREGGERGRKVRLPDMDKVRRSHRGVLTAEVAPLAPTRDTTNKRYRPNTPENYQSMTSPSIPSFDVEPTPLQNPFRSLVPPPWRQALRPPEALPTNNSYQNPLTINPANQPNYLLFPSQFNQQSQNGSMLQNALSYPRDFSQNSNVSFQNIQNPMLNPNNAQNYLHGIQNMTSNDWPQTSETFTHNISTPNVFRQTCPPLTSVQEAAATAATQNILHNLLTRNIPTNQDMATQHQNVETQNVLTTPLPQLQGMAAATATQHILNNILTQNATQNIPTQNISTPNIVSQNIPIQNWPLVNMPGIQLPLAQTGISNVNQPRLTIDGSLIAQGFQGIILKREDPFPLQQNAQTLQTNQFINPGSRPNPFLSNPVSCVNAAPNPTLNPQAMLNINNQVFLSNSLQTPLQMIQPPPSNDISIPTSVEGTNTRLPLTIPIKVSDNTMPPLQTIQPPRLIDTSIPTSVEGTNTKLPLSIPMEASGNTGPPLQVIQPPPSNDISIPTLVEGTNTRLPLPIPMEVFGNTRPPLQIIQPPPSNDISIPTSVEGTNTKLPLLIPMEASGNTGPPLQMIQPPPSNDISIPTSVEGTNTKLPLPIPMEASENTSRTDVDGSDTDVPPNDSVTGWKAELPFDLNEAVPIENLFQPITKAYIASEISYKSLDVLNWRAEALPSSALVRACRGDVQRVLCTGPGQGWGLHGHLLVSEQRRPPPVAALWSLWPRVRLQLPTPDKDSTDAAAAPNLFFQDRIYQKLCDRPLTYALVLVAINSAAVCLRLLARGAALQLYCLRTGALHPVEAQRLDDGSFLLSGGAEVEAPLAALTRRLHPPMPRRLAPRPSALTPSAPTPSAPTPSAPTPSAPTPSAPILRALISAAPRPPPLEPPPPPPAQQPPETLSSAPILSALISAARRPPAPRPITPTLQPGPSAPILPPRSPPPIDAPRSPTPTFRQRPLGLRPIALRPITPRPITPRPITPRPPKRKNPEPRSLRPGAPTVPVSALMPTEVQPTPRNSRYTAPHPDWGLSEAAFVAKYRLPKLRVRKLADELAPLIPNNRVNKMLSCLTYLGSRNARPLAGAAPVLDALNHISILYKYVMFPHQREERKKIVNRFKKLYRLPNVLGVIDGVHVPIHDVPQPHEGAFLNRAGFHSLNVQVICDADLNILNVDASQGGSAHDCAIWAAHPLNHTLTRLHGVGEAVWLLGDSGYLQRETLMTPFPTPANPPEADYNAYHAHAWDSIKHCINKLRTRWRRLTTNLPEKKARKIINACAVLHNIAQECNAPAPAVDLTRQTETDALLEEHQESAIVSLMTAPDRDRLLPEWRTGVVAREVLVEMLKSPGKHTPNIYRRTTKDIGH